MKNLNTTHREAPTRSAAVLQELHALVAMLPVTFFVDAARDALARRRRDARTGRSGPIASV